MEEIRAAYGHSVRNNVGRGAFGSQPSPPPLLQQQKQQQQQQQQFPAPAPPPMAQQPQQQVPQHKSSSSPPEPTRLGFRLSPFKNHRNN